MNRPLSLTLLILAYAASVLWPSTALANGGKAKSYTYKAKLPLGSNPNETCLLTVEVNPVLFRLTTLKEKYNVLVIRSQNDTAVSLKLSSTDDKVEILFGDTKVAGILNLAAVDRASGDSLSQYMREALAYPAQVDAHEEEGLYVFVPVDALKDITWMGKAVRESDPPKAIVLTIKSLNRSVQLRRPVTVE